MGSQRLIIEELIKTIGEINKRIDYELWFSKEYAIKNFSVNDLADPGGAQIHKELEIGKLEKIAKNCSACALSRTRKNVVFGEGSLDSDIVFIGEAPGYEEDSRGRPFVGQAGQLLSRIIQAMDMEREGVYITNVLRCRPPKNRDPYPEEVVNCRQYLLGILKIIRPKIICTLGKFATWTLSGEQRSMTSQRGKFYEFEGIKVLATFHPAYLLRNPQAKRLVWQDMKKILKFLTSKAATR